LEDYAACFDELFSRLAQRRGFREYLAGLLAPRDRNKTLTGLAGAEPIAGAQHAAVQRLQYLLSQSTWDADEINRRRPELLVNDPATAPHARGVIAIDDSGDRKDGGATAHVGRQWLGRYGKTDNGIVTVTTVWADERLYYPLHAQPYTPASHFPRKQADPEFRTKLQIAADLIAKALAAGVACRAVVADSFYGEHDDLRGALRQSGLGFVMALKPSRGTWQYGAEAYTPKDAARAVPCNGPDDPGGWHPSREPSATDTPRPGGPPTPDWAGGDPTDTPASWSPPPTRQPCRTRPPGTWPRTCPSPAARTTLLTPPTRRRT
jgi:SRSO17 transposase